MQTLLDGFMLANPNATFRLDKWNKDISYVVENACIYDAWANPQRDEPEIGIIVADWNRLPEGFDSYCEFEGFDIAWEDQTCSCSNCGNLVSTIPSYYGDTPEGVVFNDCEFLCMACLKDEAVDYLESIENNPDSASNVRGINPADYGYTKLEGEFESGFHAGQNDRPADIYKRLKDSHPRLLFVIDSSGQFDIQFSVWTKDAEDED